MEGGLVLRAAAGVVRRCRPQDPREGEQRQRGSGADTGASWVGGAGGETGGEVDDGLGFGALKSQGCRRSVLSNVPRAQKQPCWRVKEHRVDSELATLN